MTFCDFDATHGACCLKATRRHQDLRAHLVFAGVPLGGAEVGLHGLEGLLDGGHVFVQLQVLLVLAVEHLLVARALLHARDRPVLTV